MSVYRTIGSLVYYMLETEQFAKGVLNEATLYSLKLTYLSVLKRIFAEVSTRHPFDTWLSTSTHTPEFKFCKASDI